MNSLRSVFMGIMAAGAVYGGVIIVGHNILGGDMAGKVVPNLVTPTLAQVPLVTKVVTRGAKSGDTSTVTMLSPTLAPLSPTITPRNISKTVAPVAIGAVVINEIAWMGTATSSADEWLELYNVTDTPVALSGWHLVADDGKPTIALTGTVAAHGYYLIERTNDRTISDIAADLVAPFGSGLSNAGENLRLTDSGGAEVDRVDCAGGWYAGDNAAKVTMERINSAISGNMASNWAANTGLVTTGTDAGRLALRGTPKFRNSVTAP